ncbi:MAG: DUF2807 domain-containing protein [Microscillaceae bacterium]|nr:DUF2807 domain-containing protein [Microscillaceae bacterium]MDW8460129.1 DUF2807 domain-containing protein [Cytophagales bacterium]
MSENCRVEASGASKVCVNTTQNIKAHVSGASHIKYKGKPKQKY